MDHVVREQHHIDTGFLRNALCSLGFIDDLACSISSSGSESKLCAYLHPNVLQMAHMIFWRVRKFVLELKKLLDKYGQVREVLSGG